MLTKARRHGRRCSEIPRIGRLVGLMDPVSCTSVPLQLLGRGLEIKERPLLRARTDYKMWRKVCHVCC